MSQWYHLIFLAVAISLDNMVICLIYGCRKVKVSFSLLAFMDLCEGLIMVLFMGIGIACGEIITREICTAAGFCMLLLMGFWKLRESLKQWLYHRKGLGEKQKIAPELTLKNALLNSLALSADGAIISFGLALEQGNCMGLFLLTLAINLIFARIGLQIGSRISRKVSVNWSWVEGLIYLLLAFTKL